MVTWHIKNVISPPLHGLWTPNLAGWWLRIRELHPQLTWHIDQVITRQIKDVISSLSHGLWTSNLARWWLRMRGPHTKCHATFWCRGHVTNKKRYISTFTRPIDPKLRKVASNLVYTHLISIGTMLWRINAGDTFTYFYLFICLFIYLFFTVWLHFLSHILKSYIVTVI